MFQIKLKHLINSIYKPSFQSYKVFQSIKEEKYVSAGMQRALDVLNLSKITPNLKRERGERAVRSVCCFGYNAMAHPQ